MGECSRTLPMFSAGLNHNVMSPRHFTIIGSLSCVVLAPEPGSQVRLRCPRPHPARVIPEPSTCTTEIMFGDNPFTVPFQPAGHQSRRDSIGHIIHTATPMRPNATGQVSIAANDPQIVSKPT